MRRERWIAGWTRIIETEFKALATVALNREPELHAALRHALIVSSTANRVPRQIRDRYLGWLGEAAEARREKSAA